MLSFNFSQRGHIARVLHNLRHAGYVTPLASGSGKTKMAEENGGSLLLHSRNRREQSSCFAARKVLRILAIYPFVSLYSTSIEILLVS